METRIRRMLLKTCVGIVLISCYMSGVACDVPDNVVYTYLHKSVRIGDSVVLKCQFRGTPLAVYWKKGYDPNRAPNLVSWIPTDDVTGTCFGKRPCRIMDMNEDRSLVIKKVSIAEQGRYICKVTNYKGKMIHNRTDINVFSPPKKPYPFINECLGSPDMKSNRTCIISTTEDPINISCTASGYFPDLDLFFLHGSQYITALHSEETTNEDGKKTKSITSQASSSLEPYMCVASDIPGVGGRRVSSVLVTTATASVDPPDSTLAVKIVVPLIAIILLVAVVLGAIVRWHIRQHDPVSYLELWKLVDGSDLAKVEDIVNKLVENPEGNTSKEDLYRILCKWKEVSSGNVRSLYRAIKQLGFHDDLKRLKDFRASTSVSVSDDDLKHICWHVRSCKEETINPILRALYSTDTQERHPIFSTCNGFEDDLQLMKGWKSGSMPESVEFCSASEEISIQVGGRLSTPDMQEMLQSRTVGSPAGNDEDDVMAPMDLFLREVHLKVKTSPPNQMIRLSLALEEAGKTVDERNRPVYLHLAKTFFQIEDEYKSALTDEVLKEYGLSLTKPHCQRLVNILGLPTDTIADRNEDDLGVIFRTNAMLRDWVLEQKCSYYDIRRRLRRSAERCNRQDIADVFIPKDQSIIMSLVWPGFTRTDDNRRPTSSVHDATFLLPLRTNNNSFDEEFIELAYRLVMSDVHPFAEDLGISDQLLTYTPKFEPTQLYQGTISMLKAVESKYLSEMVEVLKTAGYSEEAAAIYFEPVSYVELWKLVDEGDLAKVKDIVSKLVGNSEVNTSKEDLYRILCEWKEGSSRNVRSLYRAIEQLELHDDLKRIKDFRASTSVPVSDDDLTHICLHVRSFKETVNTILRALHSSDSQGRRPILSTSNSFEDDLRKMKRWKSGSRAQWPNQTIRLCLALEEAGKTVDKRHRPVYLQMAKTFFQIRDEYESELTDEDFKKFALSLTKRHCQRLGKSLELPENIIAASNENDLGVIFRTDAMLRDWVKNQKCSDYEIRRRLRQTAERCNRHDTADIFIPKDQSNIMPLREPDYLTPTDDNQCPRISVSDGSCSKPVKTTNPPMFRRRSRRSSIFSLASTSSENEDEYILPDELDRIDRYLGMETLLKVGSNLESGDVPEQQTSNTSEREEPLLSPNFARRAFNRQDCTLPRDTLRKSFRKSYPTYACLLPMKRNDKIFDVELIELAFRLVMADIHPFAKILGISDQLLTSYKPNFKPEQLNQGTIMMLKALKTKDRSEMFKVLTTAGYSEEAKAIYFGFEISLDDVLEVEKRVDMAQLANKLGVPSCGERQNSALFRWKNTVHSSTFNHRLFLSDTIFSMGEKKLALDIISGVYRKRVINNSVSKLLANTMKQEELSTLCEVLDQKGSNCEDVINAWAGEITERSKFDVVGKYEKKPRKLSNKLLVKGFYHFAYEIMTGAWQRQEDNKSVETRPQRSHVYKAKSILTDKEMHLQKLDERGLEESSEILAPDTADSA